MKYTLQITDYIGSWTTRMVKDCLTANAGKHVDILVSSYGGSVQAGLGIYRAIKDHGDVTVWFNGFVASAATFMAMSAKEIRMSKYSLLLIHKCMSTHFIWDDLNEEQIGALIAELQKTQSDQQKIDNIISYIYADRCGKKADEILHMMSEARWLDKEDCKRCGLVDSFFDGEPVAVTDNMQNYFRYNNMPAVPDFANERTESKPINNPQNSTTMNKFWKNICAILGIENVQVDDQHVTNLTEAQADKLEADLAAKAQAIADRDNQIQTLGDQLKALKQENLQLADRVKELEKQPADESTTKVEDTEAPVVDQAAYINALNQYV